MHNFVSVIGSECVFLKLRKLVTFLCKPSSFLLELEELGTPPPPHHPPPQVSKPTIFSQKGVDTPKQQQQQQNIAVEHASRNKGRMIKLGKYAMR